jgi:predicted nucleotidyltransferase
LCIGVHNEVLDVLKEQENEIKEGGSVSKIGVFGSYVRGEGTSSSDTDIMVEFDEPRYIILWD